MDWLKDLCSNVFLITGVSSWLIAQVVKAIIYWIVNKKFDIRRLFGDGGMPSGHSATVVSVAMMAALVRGLGSFEFAVSMILAIVVCHDAMGVRRETGKQAVVLNELMELFSSEKLTKVQLKEFVGHSPLQVLAGILLGIANAVLMYFLIG